jgi:hypothetical protein
MEASMSNHGAAAIEIGTVIAILAGMAIAKQRLPVTQPLNREQPLLSAAESHRLSDRQQVNRYSSELARSTDAAELRLTRPFGGPRNKPEKGSGAGAAVTSGGFPAGR